MEPSKNSKTKLQFSWLLARWWDSIPLGYMEVGAFLLSAYILGIIYAYALKVTIHEPAAMILFIASGLLLTYISLGFVRSRSVAWLIQAFIAIALLVAAGYSRADHLITNYQADYPCFSNYETVYKGTILEDGDKSSDGDHMKYKVQLEAFYMDKEGIQENWTTLQEKPTIEVYVPIRANGNLNAYSHDNQEAYSHDNQEAHSNEKQDATQLSWANTTKDSDWMQEGDSGYSFRGGDQVLVKGKVKPIHPLDDRGEIDRQARAISQNLVGRIYDGQMQATGHKERWLSLCSSIRHKVDGMLQDHLPGNLAYVASSLLLGGHYGEIEQETMQDFSYTGLIHILSVSGSHIALISALTYGILHLCKIPKRRAVYIVILVLIAYASLVGFNPPVVRSLIMGLLLAFGLIEGRLYQARQALHMTALGLLIYAPMMVFDVSFQLSFGATYGIILFAKPLYHLLEALPILMRAPLSLCLAAQLLIIPFQLYYFHFVSLTGFLAAIVVAPLLDLVITGLFLLVLMSFLIPIGPLWSLVKGILILALWLNKQLAQAPYAYIWLGIQPLSLSLIYLSLCRGAYWYWCQRHKPFTGLAYVPLVACLFLLGLTWYQNHHLKATIIHTIPVVGGFATLAIDENNQLLAYTVDQQWQSKKRNDTNRSKTDNRSHLESLQEDKGQNNKEEQEGQQRPNDYMAYQIQKALHSFGYERPSMIISNGTTPNGVNCNYKPNNNKGAGMQILENDASINHDSDRLQKNWKEGISHLEILENTKNSLAFTIEGRKHSLAFLHGQIDPKIIQYSNENCDLIMTDNARIMGTLTKGEEGPKKCIYSPSFKAGDVIDVADSSIDVVRQEYVPDYRI